MLKQVIKLDHGKQEHNNENQIMKLDHAARSRRVMLVRALWCLFKRCCSGLAVCFKTFCMIFWYLVDRALRNFCVKKFQESYLSHAHSSNFKIVDLFMDQNFISWSVVLLCTNVLLDIISKWIWMNHC